MARFFTSRKTSAFWDHLRSGELEEARKGAVALSGDPLIEKALAYFDQARKFDTAASGWEEVAKRDLDQAVECVLQILRRVVALVLQIQSLRESRVDE